MPDAATVEDQRSLLSTSSLQPSPDTITKIVKRIRALVTRLLPVQVELNEITDATSSIITPEVIAAFSKCGGDFSQAVPFCLIRARWTFVTDGHINPTDFEESMCRASACEVLARRLIHNLPLENLQNVMSTRFRWRESDGDESAPSCALEMAIDHHCTVFLSSDEAQIVVNALWRGDWVQKNNDNNDIDYEEYHRNEDSNAFWAHLDPQRISVPRYQSAFKIMVWLIYLFVYSQTVRSPLDAVESQHQFDGWEVTLYTMTLSFLFEEVVKVIKTIRVAPKPLATINFWTIVSFMTDALLLTAFALRVNGLYMTGKGQEIDLRPSFRVLSCAAPLIWIRVLTVFEGFKIVGVLQVVVFRMLRESAIFFILLAIMALGFAQSMYALDAADGETGGGEVVVNGLIQALLGSPDFQSPNDRFGYPYGLIIYYSWNFLTTIVLVNVLIALFGSAYSDVAENATDEYLAFFAHKTIDLIRAPDQFVYLAPFNLIEAFFIAPLEWAISKEAYVKINRVVMSVVFIIPLTVIALFEVQVGHSRSGVLHDYFAQPAPEDDDDPKVVDPESDDPGGEIAVVKFDDLVKSFPNTAITESAVILQQLKLVRAQLEALEKQLQEIRSR